MKKWIECVGKIVLSLALIPLWFVKFFHDVGVLPNEDGGVSRVDYYYTVFENLQATDFSFLFYLSLAMSIAALIFAILSWEFLKNKKIIFTSRFLVVALVGVFLISVLVASTVSRGY